MKQELSKFYFIAYISVIKYEKEREREREN